MPIDCLVLHYTGMPTAEAALARLRDPAAKVSAHWLVFEDGRTLALVPEPERAWHAGISAWQGHRNLNDRSIGVEIVNPGHAHGYRPFPPAQVAAVIALCRGILARHPIPQDRVVAHSDIAPDRKEDPGELFPWAELAAAGVGWWPDRSPEADPDPEVARSLLARIGYPSLGPALTLPDLVAAFQRRFCPGLVDGKLNAATMGTMYSLAHRPCER